MRYVEGIVDYCASLETFPERGMRRDDLLSGLRITNYRKHTVIAFRVNPRARLVQIVGVFHGGQDYETAMSEPET